MAHLRPFHFVHWMAWSGNALVCVKLAVVCHSPRGWSWILVLLAIGEWDRVRKELIVDARTITCPHEILYLFVCVVEEGAAAAAGGGVGQLIEVTW